jgi:acetylglutamate kinase
MRIVKIGGNVIDHEHLLSSVLRSLSSDSSSPFILVHGGGALATKLAADLGVEQTMVGGRRITDANTLRIVTMVYAGWINKSIVAALNAQGRSSVGICGADADIIRAHKRVVGDVDFGFVGDIESVHARNLMSLITAGHDVVIAPITHDGTGQLLNTNADTIAARVAIALQSSVTSLTYIFDQPGVLTDRHDPSSVIPTLSRASAQALLARGIIADGMLPKLENAFLAAEQGIDVRIQHASDLGTERGTLITGSDTHA